MKASRDRALQEAQQARELLGQRDTPADTEAPEAYDPGDTTDYNTTPRRRGLIPSLHIAWTPPRSTYGPAFDAAYAAFVDHVSATRDMDAYNRVMNSADPGQELVRWHLKTLMRQKCKRAGRVKKHALPR